MDFDSMKVGSMAMYCLRTTKIRDALFAPEEGVDAENSWPRGFDTSFGLLYVDYWICKAGCY